MLIRNKKMAGEGKRVMKNWRLRLAVVGERPDTIDSSASRARGTLGRKQGPYRRVAPLSRQSRQNVRLRRKGDGGWRPNSKDRGRALSVPV